MSKDPYSLQVLWQDGRRTTQLTGHDPMAIRRAENQIARDPRVIARIELWDLDGRLDTLWDYSWEVHT